MRELILMAAICGSVFHASAISDPAYQNTQYAQAIPQGYKQPARPVYEAKPEGLQYYASQQQPQKNVIQRPQSPIPQILFTTIPQAQLQPQHPQQRPVQTLFYDQAVKAQQQAQAQARQSQQQQQQQAYAQPVYQPQVKYVTRPEQPVYSAKIPQQQQQQQQQRQQQPRDDQADDYDPSPSYQFGFDVKDDQYTNYQNRKEEREGNKITGSYSVVDADGYIRTVKYTADPKEGFKAEVTREPTDIVIKTPKPDPQQFQTVHRQPPVRPQYVQAAPQQRPQYAQEEDQNVVYRYQ
ncbi:cuticle protein 19.8 [Cylas formicarius]|uniref:cuticle protein 19.8 n=1 Tax=Cylas formicarius TaxID=197179 RepID=UPI0029587BB0|nr:cuticle protein 19.8 [Cylas formicarius]